MTARPRHPGLSKVVNGALVVLAFALLGFVIWRNRDQINHVFSPAAGPPPVRRGALDLHDRVRPLTFIRWFMLVRVIEPHFKLSSTFVLGSIGMVFNLVIPGGVGGDLIKASYLVRMRIRRTQAIASMVIDRILGLLALFILAADRGRDCVARSPARRADARGRSRGSRCWRACSSWWRSSPGRSAACFRVRAAAARSSG